MATNYNLRCWMKSHFNMDLFMAESGPLMRGEEENKFMIVKENPWD
jgi:hypothetical protein